MGGTLTNGGPLSSRLESFQVNRLINSELNQSGNTAPATSTFALIFKSGTLSVSDPQYKAAVTDALAPIQSNSHVVSIVTPYTVGDVAAQALTSRDGHEALVIVEVNAAG